MKPDKQGKVRILGYNSLHGGWGSARSLMRSAAETNTHVAAAKSVPVRLAF